MYTPKDLSERYGWSINICRELIKTIPGAVNRGLGPKTGRWIISTANLLRWEEGEAFGLAPAPIREPAPLRRPRFKEVIYPKNRTVAEERARLARLGETLQ